MDNLDEKITDEFNGYVVRKDLAKEVKGNAVVPTYVLEYLLGGRCTTTDETLLREGIEEVRTVLQKHYVTRSESELVRSQIKEAGRKIVLDKVSVTLNDKENCYEASFENLGITQVSIDTKTVKDNPKLLVGGVWSIVTVSYRYIDSKTIPWNVEKLKPIQMSNFDLDNYKESRRHFSTMEWLDFLLRSIGFNPEQFSLRGKLFAITRLIPFCERNYNLIELGPKGTGKSHIYSEFSPHGILISGSEVSMAKLFVNNSTNAIGLLGYWDCVAFDEFAGSQKAANQVLVDTMKNYMANKSFSRGKSPISAEASMVFIGNTQAPVQTMLRQSDLFCDLPPKFHDSAFIDRLHFYLPGWEVEILRKELFTDQYGFIVDFLAEVLHSLRAFDYTNLFQKYFELSPTLSTRDREGVSKTFSGLMKLLFPDGEASQEEMEVLLNFALEGRKRVKDQNMRIDSTYAPVRFEYKCPDGLIKPVMTREEKQYPDLYYLNVPAEPAQDTDETENAPASAPVAEGSTQAKPQGTQETEQAPLKIEPQQIMILEDRTGVTFDWLFGKYLVGETDIVIEDPYIIRVHQFRNLVDFLDLVLKKRGASHHEIQVHLITKRANLEPEDMGKDPDQETSFRQIKDEMSGRNLTFTWEYSQTLHDRFITLKKNGARITLGRGLDIYKRPELNNFVQDRLQAHRSCYEFTMTVMPSAAVDTSHAAL